MLCLLKHRKSCEKLPWESVRCQGVKVFFLLKYVIITSSVTTVIFITITIGVFEFGHNLIFQVLSQFVFLGFITVWVLEFCHNLGLFFLVLSVFVTIWVFEFCHNLSFWVLSQFEFWILSQFSFLVLSQFEFLNFVTFKNFVFGLTFSFWVLSQFEFWVLCHYYFHHYCHLLPSPLSHKKI